MASFNFTSDRVAPRVEHSKFIFTAISSKNFSIHIDKRTRQLNAVVSTGKNLLIAACDGIGLLDKNKNTYTKAGLSGRVVHFLYKHPQNSDLLFASLLPNDDLSASCFYISNNGGYNWEAASGSLFSESLGRAYCFHYLFLNPNERNHLYAILEDDKQVVVSYDGGYNWELFTIIPDSAISLIDIILQCERFDKDLFVITELQWLKHTFDNPFFENNFFHNASNPIIPNPGYYNTNSEFDRVPTSIPKLNPTHAILNTFSSNSMNQMDNLTKKNSNDYYGWVNPMDKSHILYWSSQPIGNPKALLYESCDGGLTIHPVSLETGLPNPSILTIVTEEDCALIVVVDYQAAKLNILKCVAK